MKTLIRCSAAAFTATALAIVGVSAASAQAPQEPVHEEEAEDLVSLLTYQEASDGGLEALQEVVDGADFDFDALDGLLEDTVHRELGVDLAQGIETELSGPGESVEISGGSLESDHTVAVSVADAEVIESESGAMVAEAGDAESFVAHSTANGGQILYVLEDDTAASSFDIDLDAPAGSTWEQQEDGDYLLSSAEGEALLVMAQPWAVDAEGAVLETSFEFTDSGITQVIDTADVSFPVVADPSFWWYTKKSASCIASVGSLAIAGAKIAQISVKVFNVLKKAKSGTKLYDAFTAWKKLGGTNSARLKNLLNGLKTFAGYVVKHGLSTAKSKMKKRGGYYALTVVVVYNGAAVIADVTGLSDCVSVVTGKDY